MRNARITATVCVVTLTLSGCLNTATPPSQITSSYISPVTYAQFNCEQLAVEQASLARRENQLAIAQEGRRKSSRVQALWYGFGNGDGVEASELANVRGQQEAARSAMATKRCGTPQAEVQPAAAQPATVQPATTPEARERNRVRCVTC